MSDGEWVEIRTTIPLGGMVPVELDGATVVIASIGDGHVAFDDSCTHRACPLSEGVLADGSITCPCHRSRFDLATGQPLNGPATEPIRIRRVRHEGGRLLIER